ncbi:MAG: sulfurtransferase [Betaproteobacteria bacterium]|nr:MAG: sulfurtransferase [Betaproteobacteria bacterium]
MDAAISTQQLSVRLASETPPLVIDVRRELVFRGAPDLIAGALRRDPDRVDAWAEEIPPAASVVVYCVHGQQVSQNAATALRDRGREARYLDHGIEGWRETGGPVQGKPQGSATRWVTRERPKIDRIACPWLIARFIDRDAEFLYVPAPEVRAVAAARTATAFDIENVELGHAGDRCSFDAFVARFRLGSDPALLKLAAIVRGADTGRLDLAPESAGLLAASMGLSLLHADDHVMLRHGTVLYDALYRWCKEGCDQAATWQWNAPA